jgi:hypothetical protein
METSFSLFCASGDSSQKDPSKWVSLSCWSVVVCRHSSQQQTEMLRLAVFVLLAVVAAGKQDHDTLFGVCVLNLTTLCPFSGSTRYGTNLRKRGEIVVMVGPGHCYGGRHHQATQHPVYFAPAGEREGVFLHFFSPSLTTYRP